MTTADRGMRCDPTIPYSAPRRLGWLHRVRVVAWPRIGSDRTGGGLELETICTQSLQLASKDEFDREVQSKRSLMMLGSGDEAYGAGQWDRAVLRASGSRARSRSGPRSGPR